MYFCCCKQLEIPLEFLNSFFSCTLCSIVGINIGKSQYTYNLYAFYIWKEFSFCYSLSCILCKVSNKKPIFGHPSFMGNFFLVGRLWIHTSRPRNLAEPGVVPAKNSENRVDDNGTVKVKRKKLKGKRAVVRWLKSFRYKKKKEYERMAAEEKILYKLRKVISWYLHFCFIL